ITDLSGTGGLAFSDVDITVTPNNYEDTDGDTVKDARLYNTGATNADGDEYWAAVRVIDLGGLLNLNTAAQNDPTGVTMFPPVTDPVNVKLKAFFASTPAVYIALHTERADNTPDLREFSANSAHQLLSPVAGATTYLPFGIGDEMHLRYLDSSAITDRTGRLYDATKDASFNPLADTTRQHLTTFNCSRTLTRDPNSDPNSMVRLLIDSATALDDPNDQQMLYERILASMGTVPVTPTHKKEAAHFVANLWARIGGYNPTEAYSFQPTDPVTATLETFTVYGVVEQPVFSEAFAYSRADDPATVPIESSAYAYAIELYNPTKRNIDLGYDAGTQTGYVLLRNNTTLYEFPAGTTINSNDRLFFYDYEGAITDEGGVVITPDSDPNSGGFGFGDANATRLQTPALEFCGDTPNSARTIKLVRVVAGTDILIDKISGSDFGYPVTDRTDNSGGDPLEASHGARDDNFDRQRSLIPSMEIDTIVPLGDPVTSPIDTVPELAASLTFGGSNNLLASDLSSVYEGFAPPDTRQALVDLGELSELYTVGPELDGLSLKSLPERLDSFKGQTSRGKLDFIGDVGSNAATHPDVPWATVIGELFELVRPDNSRLDEPPPTRIYGRINVNTATRDILQQLPFGSYLGWDVPTSTWFIDLDNSGSLTTGFSINVV
ncbi:hypothetical protein LCGC14_2126870, partial [marine sediment metagenome]